MMSLNRLPVLLALAALLFGGILLVDRADAQARDTIRKHHLEDIERSLYFARSLRGTYPPYGQPTWCGLLNDPANANVRAQVEEALRSQHEQYGNLEKPFPTDPAAEALHTDYFYWKRSDALFELYSVLEADPNGERSSQLCPGAAPQFFDYGIVSSRERELHAPSR